MSLYEWESPGLLTLMGAIPDAFLSGTWKMILWSCRCVYAFGATNAWWRSNFWCRCKDWRSGLKFREHDAGVTVTNLIGDKMHARLTIADDGMHFENIWNERGQYCYLVQSICNGKPMALTFWLLHVITRWNRTGIQPYPYT
jgi:hypothetical protein